MKLNKKVKRFNLNDAIGYSSTDPIWVLLEHPMKTLIMNSGIVYGLMNRMAIWNEIVMRRDIRRSIDDR
jgi:hypothetical protein